MEYRKLVDLGIIILPDGFLFPKLESVQYLHFQRKCKGGMCSRKTGLEVANMIIGRSWY